MQVTAPIRYDVDVEGKALTLTFFDVPGPGHPDPASFIPARTITATLALTDAVVADIYTENGAAE